MLSLLHSIYQLKFIHMATIDHLFDSGQGLLGNLVLYKVGGKGRIRTRPARYRDKKSPAQLAQRQRMQVMLQFLKPFSRLLRITYAAEAVGRSAIQAAQSYNMRHALAGEYPDIYVNKSKALLSLGPLPVPVAATLTAQPEGLLIEWENDPEAARHHPHDTLVIMALSEVKGYTDVRFTETRRSQGRHAWTPVLPAGPVAVWIAFRNQAQTEMGESFYVGEGLIV
jgi:hypothetical protein